MAYTFGRRSIERLKGVHPKLIEVAELALSRSLIDYTVGPYGGKRTLDVQKMLKARGSSRTLKSRHLDGCAIDMVTWRRLPTTGKYGYDWSRWSDYVYIAKLMKQAAIELNVPIQWGGDWQSFKDGPHFHCPAGIVKNITPLFKLFPSLGGVPARAGWFKNLKRN